VESAVEAVLSIKRIVLASAGVVGLSLIAFAADAGTFASVADSIAAGSEPASPSAATLALPAPDAASTVTVDSRMWAPNGTVYSVVSDAGTIYIGGEFSYVGPVTGGAAAIDANTSFVRRPYARVLGTVYAVAPDGNGGWFLGGDFTSVGGQPRNRLARIDADGNVTAWNPNAHGLIRGMAVSGGVVYVGGDFDSIGGQPRSHIAAIDAADGSVTAWDPNADGGLIAVAVSGGVVYAGGGFRSIGGQPRNNIAALDSVTGAATSWNPDASGTVIALAVGNGVLYAGGAFGSIGGQSRNNIAAIDVASGAATGWNPNADQAVYALAVSGGVVFAGGTFSYMGGQQRVGIAMLDAASGAVTDWNPTANASIWSLTTNGNTVVAGGYFTTIGGQPRSRLAALDAGTGAATGWDPGAGGLVASVAASGGTVYAGGAFTSMGGQTRNNLAALDATTGAATAWNPNANGYVSAMAMSAGVLYVGGHFTNMGGQPRNAIAALDAASGAATGWNPDAGSSAFVEALAVVGGTIYVGGDFYRIGGQVHTAIAALDVTTGAATDWNPGPRKIRPDGEERDPEVSALAVNGNTIYASGDFTSIGGQLRAGIAALDVGTGLATGWNPSPNGSVDVLAASGATIYAGGSFTTIGGQPRNNLAALHPTSGAASGWDPNANGNVSALALGVGTVYVGGRFSSIGGQPRSCIAALDATSGAATDWDPNADNYVRTLAVSGGAIIAGGGFGAIGGTYQPYLAAILPDGIIPDPNQPQPAFIGSVFVGPAPTVTIGRSFTVTTSVSNFGRDSDDGRISISFPTLSAAADSERVSVSGGDDPAGARVMPAGSGGENAVCGPMTRSYLGVEYTDPLWAGNGSETHQLVLTVKPPAVGLFPIQFRSTMHTQGTVCSFVNDTPALMFNSTDEQGWTVGTLWVNVLAPSPPAAFAAVTGIPATVPWGESFTFTATASRNDPGTNPGRIVIGFPTLTSAAAVDSASSTTTGDTPGYLEHAAGSLLPDSAGCQSVAIGHLVVEYVDAAWAQGEPNAFAVTVTPPTPGTFFIDVRATVEGNGIGCGAVNSLPPGATVATDDQGWTVRRYAVTVTGPPGPPPVPSVAWAPISPPAGGPGARYGAAGVYHPARDALLIYGGSSPAYQSDIWSLPLAPGGAWSQITPGGPTPLRRIMHSMILNPVDDQLVVFGGLYNDFLNDLNVMTLTTPWWFPNPGQGSPPSARGGHAAIYDPVRRRMLVIGGFDGGLENDVWEYTPPGTGAWHLLAVGGTPMPPRLQHTAIYDPTRDRVIVFGGDGGPFLNDVWALNLSGTPNWEQLSPLGLAPSPRREATAIYDAVMDRMIVYGGFDDSRQWRGDLWALDFVGAPVWTRLISSTPSPAGRAGHISVYDPVRHRMVMFGGQLGSTQYSNEVWGLDLGMPTAVTLSLTTTEVERGLVRLTWDGVGVENMRAELYRAAGADGEWTALGSPSVENGRLIFEDRDVQPGARYGYQLAVQDGTEEVRLDPVWVTIPQPAMLSLAGASPNPSENGIAVRFSLPGKDPATLELFDLGGRLVASREVGSLGAGEHLVSLSERLHLSAGVYLIRLTQAGRALTAKACVVR